MKHTPGPWKIKEAREDYELVDSHDNTVAQCPRYGVSIVNKGEDTPVRLAQENARLISAAPELLAALKLFADEYLSVFQEDYKDTPLDDIYQQAKAAIKKAEGE